MTITFEMLTNFGMFRDLHRHRILTLERQLLSTKHGYDVPKEIYDLEFWMISKIVCINVMRYFKFLSMTIIRRSAICS